LGRCLHGFDRHKNPEANRLFDSATSRGKASKDQVRATATLATRDLITLAGAVRTPFEGWAIRHAFHRRRENADKGKQSKREKQHPLKCIRHFRKGYEGYKGGGMSCFVCGYANFFEKLLHFLCELFGF
jgi:hypothetical protein